MNLETNFFEKIFYSNLGVEGLYNLYEALCNLNNYKFKLQEGSALNNPDIEQQVFLRLLDKATKASDNLIDRVSLQNNAITQARFENIEELTLDVIEQQYKMASDEKSNDYKDVLVNCGDSLNNFISVYLKQIYKNADVPLYHVNGDKVESTDFNMHYYMNLAKRIKGIDFKALLAK